MKIVIKDSKPDYWYKDSIGKVFDVELKIHPTFKYEEYVLLNTDRNKKYFENDELSLLILENGLFGIAYEDVRKVID